MTMTLTLQPGALTLAELRAVWNQAAPLALASEAYPVIEASAAAVRAIVAKGMPPTASTPASASWPKPASPTTSSNNCSAT